MKNLTAELGEFISEAPVAKKRKGNLTISEERLFRSLKTQGERSVKGRDISNTIFEAKSKAGISLLMIMEGRHSMSVGNQVARRFDGANDVDSVEVIRTKAGACVVVRPKKDEE